MTMEPIGTSAAVIYITLAELRAQGLTPETMTAQAAAELARTALIETDMQAEGKLEIEAYHAPLGVLLFVHIRKKERWFSFDGLEELLQGVQALPHPRPDGMLALWEGRYWLGVWEQQGIDSLTEFGESETPMPYFQARLEEQGAMLLSAQAPEKLGQYFKV